MPPMTAAASARTSVLGPRVTRSVADPVWPAISAIDNVASAPATAHTNIDTRVGLMPLRRARSRFSADAFTVLPNVVRVRNHERKTATSGTTIRIESCAPVIRIDAISCADPIASGKRATAASMFG